MASFESVRANAGPDTLLAALSDDQARQVYALGKLRTCARGEALFEHGDPGESAYLILSGAVKISIVSPSGREIVFAYLSTGDMVGEISVLDGSPRTAAATAAESAEVLVIRGADLHRQIAASPELAAAVIKFLCLRIRATNELLESDRSYQTGPRLARGILRLLREHGRDVGEAERINVAISQSDLGAFVSLSRENVNRQIRDWTRAGILEVQGGRILVKDRDALEDAAAIVF